MPIGELFLGAFLQVLFDRLASRELLSFARRERLYSRLKKWREIVLSIQAVLNDAEDKQIRDSAVGIWLDDLRDLAYDVDDVLDEFSTEALRRRLMAGGAQARSGNKVCGLVPSCFTSLNPSSIMFDVRMGGKVREITSRLQDIVKRKDDLDLRESEGGGNNRARERVPTTSLVDESRVYGRGKDKGAILEMLVGGEGSSNEVVSVIPILGMGGVGKTTLAQLVYNDERVMGCFDLKAWVYVSEDFDIFRITKSILQSITSETCDNKDLNLLQVKLKEELSGKRYLIVLDDVWSESYGDWDTLCNPFRTGVAGCKIVVTTRNNGVVSIMGTVLAYSLKELSHDDCLSLFVQHSLGEKDFDAHPNLKRIGEGIVKRCKGLPLAAKTLGGLLRNKVNQEEWEDLLNSKIWDLSEERSDILPALRLSYYHLPSHLKQCFAFCAMFPKDYEFDKHELVLLWMAEGLLQQHKGKKKMEDLGLEYFHDLVARSFFQQSSNDKSRFVMHDLIHDLAQSVAGEICYNLEDKLEGSILDSKFEKVRHSSFNSHRYDISQRFEVFYKMKNLRTLVALPIVSSDCYLSSQVLHDLLPKLRRLRVLSLSDYFIRELPDSIGELKHLRYLDLSSTSIEFLPESVGTLYNLQTLLLRWCRRLLKLPQGLGNLINLRHLDITGSYNLHKMPLQIGNLTNLQQLPKFIVGKGGELKLRKLKDLIHLQGELLIEDLQNVVDARDARVANMKDKHGLNELSLEWTDDFHDLRDETNEMHVLNLLQPHKNLKKLTVACYGGLKFPSWIGDSSVSNLVELNLCDCPKSTSLPSLGRLPLLRYLQISGFDGIKSIGIEFYGSASSTCKPFPSLETLVFESMLEWENWSFATCIEEAEVTFPCLGELTLRGCPKLVGKLPSHLPTLKKLDISKCPQLTGLSDRLPSLRELNLEECNEMVLRSTVELKSLTIVKIKRIFELACLCKGFMQVLLALEVLEIEDCSELMSLCQDGVNLENLACLKRLSIWSCPKLVSLLLEDGCILPFGLKVLELYVCDNLEKLPNGLQSLSSLRRLSIHKCPKLLSFPATGLPHSLKSLELADCEALESLPNGIMVMNGSNSNQYLLENLLLENCPSLRSFPRGLKLPTTLKRLEIRNCANLQFLPEGLMHNQEDGISMSQLEELTISRCLSLTSFPAGEFPAALKKLSVWDCLQLESLTRRMLQNNTSLEDISIVRCTNLLSLPLDGLYSMTHLRKLLIERCPALESFPEAGLPMPNLKSLIILNCENLKSLPNQMQSMPLEELMVSNCPSLESFPDEGLPPTLISLDVWYCKNLKQLLSEWGLYRLTSLTRFTIVRTSPLDMASFPDDECCVLPTSLTFLRVDKINNLKSLSKGLQNLSSLEELEIASCPKLRLLPKEGLPASLGKLSISKCPLLNELCLKEKGEYWPIIANIPCVYID